MPADTNSQAAPANAVREFANLTWTLTLGAWTADIGNDWIAQVATDGWGGAPDTWGWVVSRLDLADRLCSDLEPLSLLLDGPAYLRCREIHHTFEEAAAAAMGAPRAFADVFRALAADIDRRLCIPTPPADSIPTVPGTPFGGGFYAGRLTDADGRTYALVVAPKAEGESVLAWKKRLTATAGARSLSDGFANSDAMNDAAHPAAQFCRGLEIAGHTDWYLPARDELEVLYRAFKPTADRNWTCDSRAKAWGVAPGTYNGVDEPGNGHNAASIPPGAPYSADIPAQTEVEAFRDGGAEAFARGWYWSSTEFSSAYAWVQPFDDGVQLVAGKLSRFRCRAVRTVLI